MDRPTICKRTKLNNFGRRRQHGDDDVNDDDDGDDVDDDDDDNDDGDNHDNLFGIGSYNGDDVNDDDADDLDHDGGNDDDEKANDYNDVDRVVGDHASEHHDVAQWFRIAKDRDQSTGPLARPFRSFTRTVHSFACSALLALLALLCSLCSLTPLWSFVYSITHSRARKEVNGYFFVLDHSALVMAIIALEANYWLSAMARPGQYF